MDLLNETEDKTAELYIRGVKDVLADTGEEGGLKRIIALQDEGLFFFFASFMDNIRAHIFPELKRVATFFLEERNWADIEAARLSGYQKALKLREEFLTLRRESGDIREIEKTIISRLNAEYRGK